MVLKSCPKGDNSPLHILQDKNISFHFQFLFCWIFTIIFGEWEYFNYIRAVLLDIIELYLISLTSLM